MTTQNTIWKDKNETPKKSGFILFVLGGLATLKFINIKKYEWGLDKNCTWCYLDDLLAPSEKAESEMSRLMPRVAALSVKSKINEIIGVQVCVF